jgi:hypothetical protein
MFSIFVLFFGIQWLNRYLDSDANKLTIPENSGIENNPIQNYYPLFFHSVIILLILISFFSPAVLDQEKVHVLISDGIFQFVSTVLILIISIINPFVNLSPELRMKIEDGAEATKAPWLSWLTKGKNWQLLKALACILIVAYFIYQGYLVIPNFNQGTLSGVAVILILFFVFGNIFELIKDPVLFKKKTVFRLSMLYRSIKLSFFISIVLIILGLIISSAFNKALEKVANIEAVVLLIYNVVMVVNEFKVLQARN